MWRTCPVRRPPPRAKDSGSEEPRELEGLGARRLAIWGSESREDRRRMSFLLLEGYLQASSFGITMISSPDCKYNSFFFPKKFKCDEMHEFKHKRSSEITNAQCWLHTFLQYFLLGFSLRRLGTHFAPGLTASHGCT